MTRPTALLAPAFFTFLVSARALAMDFAVPAHPIDVLLGRPTDRSTTVSVVAYQAGDGYVEYGPASGGTTTKTPAQPFSAETGVEFALDDLLPNSPYTYRVFWRSGTEGAYSTTAARTFRTARPAGQDFTFTIQADSHLDSNTSPALYARMLENALADAPDFHIDLGDTYMTDKYGATFTDARPQYYAQRYYFSLLCGSAPLFFVMGNHDGEAGYAADGTSRSISAWSANLRKNLFPNPLPDSFYSGNPTPEPSIGLLQNWFAFTWGDVLIVALDPFWPTRQRGNGSDNWNWTLGKEQYDWLRRTLEGSRAKLKLVFVHHLVGGFGKDRRGGVEAAHLWEWGGSNEDGSPGFAARRPGWPEPLHPLFVRTGVAAVFHGHDHLFVKQEKDGIVYQEVPQPGFPRLDSTGSAATYGYVTGTILGSSGHLRVKVSGGNATVDYVRSLLPADETASRKNRDVVFSYVLAGRAAQDTPAATWFLPSSARVPGEAGAIWTTDLSVANTGTTEASVTLKFLGHDVDGRTGSEKTFALAAGKSVTWSDVLGSVFGAETDWGAIRVSSTTPSLAVTSQSYTPRSGGGTFGQSVPAFASSEWIMSGTTKALAPIREDSTFRTNLILANATEATLEVAGTLVSTSGTDLGSARWTLPPLGMTQVTHVVRTLGVAGDVAGARLQLSTPTAGGAFTAYASLIDAGTNDPRTLLPR
ncbi:MAG: metallophosphoesterase [Thermoanaerobaculia bacterium]|nr:metallophosphoesterase [Thermoanaerobaculia bacterium]